MTNEARAELSLLRLGVLFTAIAYVGVWLLVGAYWLCGQTTESPLWIVIATLCMMMPLIATIILQRIEKEPVLHGLCIRWKPNRWWFVAWLLPALLTAATVGISCLLPGIVTSIVGLGVLHFTDRRILSSTI